MYLPVCKWISYAVLILTKESYPGHITLINIVKISRSSKEAQEIWGERDVMWPALYKPCPDHHVVSS